jgi:hypothetical protein
MFRPHKSKWNVSIRKDELDRRREKQTPLDWGCFWFWHTTPVLKAFNRLKECMIKAHNEEIERLIKSRDALQRLTLDDKEI